MDKGRTEMEIGADGVAVITVVNPPFNALSIDALYSLVRNYEEACRMNDVRAIVLVGKGGIFCGGLDISILGAIQKHIFDQLKVDCIDAMTDALEVAKKPLVAAIDGLAFGAGLELSMACQARISTPTAQLCFPELQLGVIPGFGGTQRLPRLVGLKEALEMILLSKHIRAEEAHRLGLVDAIVSSEELLSTARHWALDISESRRPLVRVLSKTDKLEPPEEAREILKYARDQAQKRAPNLKHHLICIDVIEEGIVSGPRAGLRKEGVAFQELFFSYTCKSLVHVFFSQRATLKIAGVTDLGLMPRNVTKVAVVGGGLIGSGVTTTLILNHYPVILKEVNEKILNAGVDRIKANLQRHVRKGKLTEEECEKTLSLLTGVLDYERFKEADLVIEAVIENVKLKQQIFAELERHCPPHCIFATTTSTINLELIGQDTNSQERIVGAHFFTPAHIMPLVEIVRTQDTSQQAVIDLLEVAKKIKKTPIVVTACSGFAVNRMFFPYTRTAHFLLDRGMDLYKIDRACTEFGMTVGPFRRKAIPDPETMKYVEKLGSTAGASTDPELVKLEDKNIVEMVLFPAINEACRLLNESIVAKASDLDVASIMGMGFPPYRGGIMYWADSIGAKRIHVKLSEWEKKYGQFFRPCSYLSERAAAGVPLSAPTGQAKARL